MQLNRIIKIKSSRDFILLWYLFVSCGIVKFSSYLSTIIVKLLPLRSVQFQLLEWAYIDKGTKPYEIIQYGLSVFLLFWFFIITYRWLLKSHRFRDSSNIAFLLHESNTKYLQRYFILLAVISCALLFFPVDKFTSLVIFVAWGIVIIYPILHVFDISSWSNTRQQSLLVFLTMALTIQLLSYYLPLIIEKPFILNDYMDIPEQTFLDSRYVDNTTYINKNNIGGIIKYDPRIHKGSSPLKEDLSLAISATDELYDFVELHKHKYFYDQEFSALIISGPMTMEEHDALKFVVSEHDREKLAKLYTKSNLYYHFININEGYDALGIRKDSDEGNRKIGYYSKEVYEFITKNGIEMINQSVAGHFFHHHNYQLGPLNERVLGKEPSKIMYVYGWFSSLILEYTMNKMGGINYKNYLNASYVYYLLYYLLLAAIIIVIFREIRYLCLFLIIQITALNLIGYELLQMAPGFNPLRHFLDPIILLLLHLFTKKQNPLYMALSLIFAALSVLFNKEFGLFIFAAVVTTLVFIVVNEKRTKQSYINYFLIAIAVVSTFFSLFLIKQKANELFIYTLVGVSLPPVSDACLYMSMIAFTGLYLFLINKHDSNNPFKYLLLYLLLYTQCAYIYFVWNPAPNHVLVLAPIWGTMIVILLKMIFDNVKHASLKQTFLISTIVILFIFLNIPTTLLFYREKYEHIQVRNNHKIFNWDFERAGFDSTMDPSVFKNDVALINKYVPHEKSMYIISKYDNLLPFLAGKYSSMPYLEVFSSLVTHKEINNCINTILNDKPEYIFVDTDINRNLNGDKYYKKDIIGLLYPTLYDASSGRIIMLKYLRKVYLGIQQNYELAEKGFLVSAYKLKKDHKNQKTTHL